MTRLISIAALLLLATPAMAHARHHHRHHHYARHYRHRHNDDVAVAHRGHDINIIWENSPAGPIEVARRLAGRFKGLITDFADAGYNMTRVHCFAATGHVKNSRHHIGEACDFNQHGWGKTDPFMYTQEAALIIRKWGFTNGCKFKDCGHVGTDGQGHGTRYALKRRRHYAHHHLRHYAHA